MTKLSLDLFKFKLKLVVVRFELLEGSVICPQDVPLMLKTSYLFLKLHLVLLPDLINIVVECQKLILQTLVVRN